MMASRFFSVSAVVTLFSLLCVVSAAAAEISNPEELVNVLGGTSSRYDTSHGSTLPLFARPHGFNHYTIQTDDDDNWSGWFFHPSDRRYFGLRVTHQPSPWIRDYGNFLVRATIPSTPTSDFLSDDQFTGYSPDKSFFSPYLFRTSLFAFNNGLEFTKVEFTPHQHSGMMRVTFPSFISDSGYRQSRRISVILNGLDGEAADVSAGSDGAILITGRSTANSGGVGDTNVTKFAHHFVIAIYGGGDKPLNLGDDMIERFYANTTGAFIDFQPNREETKVLTLRLATSFISLEQAKLNLQQEVEGRPFDSIVAETKKIWRDALGKVEVELPQSYARDEARSIYVTFYSCLYRSLLFPRQLGETDGLGNERHFSPYAGDRVRPGSITVDSGFWDSWNSVYSLLSLVDAPTVGAMVKGFLNTFRASGWVTSWPSPGPRASMVSTMQDVVIADAIVNNIPGFDRELAYSAIRKNAFTVPADGESEGRGCLQSYLDNGYVARGARSSGGGTCYEVASVSLNYMQSDYAISQAARHLGRADDHDVLLQRSKGYSQLFDSESGGFFRAKEGGLFVKPFDRFQWGTDYTEGGPYQYRFYVPHDAAGLAALYAASGLDMCAELEKGHEIAGAFHVGDYGSEIHEQTEMLDHCWGQYAHNNQPVHHMLYMYFFQGTSCAHKAHYYLRKVLSSLYRPGSDMFPGDEDNGEMGAWYVLSSLGLYNRNPGSGSYFLGSPLFSRALLKLSSGNTLTVEAKGNSRDNVYVKAVTFNGATVEGFTLSYAALMAGGVLSFEMSGSY